MVRVFRCLLARFGFSDRGPVVIAWPMATYERLAAWQACHELWIAVYHTTAAWPIQERYGLTSQIRRAALSASCNIAEGVARRGSRELARFLSMSLGSLAEVSCLLRSGRDVGVIDRETFNSLVALEDKAGRITMGLYKSVRGASTRPTA